MGALKNLISRLDALVSQIVRKNRCKRCASWASEPAHVFGRKNLSVRWDFDNVIPLCRRCHGWAHGHEEKFKEFVRMIFGDERYDKLVLKANSVKIWTEGELLQLEQDLKCILAR